MILTMWMIGTEMKARDVICSDVNMVRKRARRTPKPVITEAKSGRRCDDVPAGADALCQADTDADGDDYILADVSLKDVFCLVMVICSLN